MLRAAGDSSASTNDPTRRYAVSKDAVSVLTAFGSEDWGAAVQGFKAVFGNFSDRLERKRVIQKIPVVLPSGQEIALTPGRHNELQRAIVQEFLPRFSREAEVLYIGDTAKRVLCRNDDQLKELGFSELAHETLPDVVAYERDRNWLFLIEAVHSANPISKTRHLKLEELTKGCSVPRIYVSAFDDRKSFRKWITEISWETEVWLVESPDHLSHFDGVKFLGPYEDGEGT